MCPHHDICVQSSHVFDLFRSIPTKSIQLRSYSSNKHWFMMNCAVIAFARDSMDVGCHWVEVAYCWSCLPWMMIETASSDVNSTVIIASILSAWSTFSSISSTSSTSAYQSHHSSPFSNTVTSLLSTNCSNVQTAAQSYVEY